MKVDTLWGKLDLRIQPGTSEDEIITLQGHGIPKLPPHSNRKGNHIVKLRIAVPNKLSDAQRRALEAYSKVEEKIE